jgi:hypothetical protein
MKIYTVIVKQTNSWPEGATIIDEKGRTLITSFLYCIQEKNAGRHVEQLGKRKSMQMKAKITTLNN